MYFKRESICRTLCTTHRAPVRTVAAVLRTDTGRIEVEAVGVIGIRRERRRRPVVTVATLIVDSLIVIAVTSRR
jgi:hypothetical protein